MTTAIAAQAADAERLVVLASLARPDADEQAALHEVARKVEDWAEVLAVAEAGATVPLVQHRLEGEDLFSLAPPPVQDGFRAVSDAVATANDRRLEGALAVLRRFDDAGIVCVVLKGMLFASEVYDDARYKRMNDIDVLVEIERIPEVIEILDDLDLICLGELFGEEPRARPKRSHHLPPYVARDGSLFVGTHWGLITPLAPYTIDYDAIWSRVRTIDFYGVPAAAMAHEDNLHHLCIHLPYYKTGVRELADIWNLLRHAGDDFDVDLLLGEIRKAGSENLVFHALGLVNRLVPTEAGEQIAATVAGDVSRWYRYDTERKTRDVHTLLRSRSTHTSAVEKAYAEFNALHDAREKFEVFRRLWATFWVPPQVEAFRMSSLDEPSRVAALGARVSAPYRLAKVFQRDLGKWLFPLAMVKTIVDMGVVAGRQAAGRAGEDEVEDFAARVGLTKDQLRAFAESQE